MIKNNVIKKLFFTIFTFLNLIFHADALTRSEEKVAKKIYTTAKMGISYGIKFQLRNYSVEASSRIINHKIKGETALIVTSKGGNKKTAKALLKKGADPNIEDNINKRTPLIWSTIGKHRKTNAVLLEYGAILDYKDIYGRTALFYAVKNKDKKTAEQLLRAGADVSLADDSGMNSIALAKALGDRPMVNLLMKYFRPREKWKMAYKKIEKMQSMAKAIEKAKNIAEVKKKWNSLRLMVDGYSKINYLKKEKQKEDERKRKKREKEIAEMKAFSKGIGDLLEKRKK